MTDCLIWGYSSSGYSVSSEIFLQDSESSEPLLECCLRDEGHELETGFSNIEEWPYQ